MIDGVLGICQSCGAELTALHNIDLVQRQSDLTVVTWRCKECGYMGRNGFGREWFKTKLTPAIRWWAKKEGPRPFTEAEHALRLFAFDLAGVETVSDLDLYWRAQPANSIPLEKRA